MIKEKIRDFLHNDPDFKSRMPEKLEDTDSLIESGIIDSFGIVSLVSFIEKEFDIKVEMEDLSEETFDTLVNIERFISGKS